MNKNVKECIKVYKNAVFFLWQLVVKPTKFLSGSGSILTVGAALRHGSARQTGDVDTARRRPSTRRRFASRRRLDRG